METLDDFFGARAERLIGTACAHSKIVNPAAASLLWQLWAPHMQRESARMLGEIAAADEALVRVLPGRWKSDPVTGFEAVAIITLHRLMTAYNLIGIMQNREFEPAMMFICNPPGEGCAKAANLNRMVFKVGEQVPIPLRSCRTLLCRCTWVALSERQLGQFGLSLEQLPAYATRIGKPL